jgi:phosphoribosylamine--glycine ligase
MKVLILGSGGREHALAWKINQSNLLSELYIAPGNAGTEKLGKNIPLNTENFAEVKDFVIENKIGMVVVGPEAPLVAGIHDFFHNDPELKGIAVIGPSKQAAMLEGSKDFAKTFMKNYKIPTAEYRTFDSKSLEKALEYLKIIKPPYVIKADGLAAGKGVLICQKLSEAEDALRSMLVDAKFGKAGEKVVIEEYLDGIELSAFVLTDGNHYVILPEAKDYKRIGEGDKGLNTGGMGSISPVPFATGEFMKKVEDRIIKPTIEGLQSDGINYKGFIFFGLMSVAGDPYVIEYNARMGDPEAESTIPRIKSDLLELFIAVSEEKLKEKKIETDPSYCAAVMAVSGGYPEKYEKGKEITGLEKIKGSIVFHAGTKTDPETGKTLTSGGRVFAITSLAATMKEALEKTYSEMKGVTFEKMYYREDLGKDLERY